MYINNRKYEQYNFAVTQRVRLALHGDNGIFNNRYVIDFICTLLLNYFQNKEGTVTVEYSPERMGFSCVGVTDAGHRISDANVFQDIYSQIFSTFRDEIIDSFKNSIEIADSCNPYELYNSYISNPLMFSTLYSVMNMINGFELRI